MLFHKPHHQESKELQKEIHTQVNIRKLVIVNEVITFDGLIVLSSEKFVFRRFNELLYFLRIFDASIFIKSISKKDGFIAENKPVNNRRNINM